MNKVFKVIWSEARNAYVVVSEIAKNHGSKGCSTKKLLTMLIATGVMTCASMAPAMAANPAPDDKNVTIGKGAVSSPYVGQTGNVAIGENAKAWNGNGRQEAYVDFGQGGIKGGWLGVDVKDGTKLPGSIAIGKNTVARSGSTMIGDHGYTGKIGDTTITPDGNGIMKYNNDVYSTTIGANSFNSGALASVTGVFSIASSKFDGSGGFNTLYAVQNTGATIYGSMNSIESATSSSMYSGVANSVLGFANRTQNANAALVWGTGNEVTNSVETIDIDTDWNNVSVAEAQQKAIKAMQTSDYAGGSVMAIGGGNKADYAKYSQLTGVQNKVTGTKAKAAKYDFVNGYKNTVTEASDVTVIGGKNEVTADGNKVIGDNHKVSGTDNVIFGSADQLTETTVNNAVVLGHNAQVTGEGGVALGAGSVADRANAVSVGSTDAERQIINVAEGKADTDAVNVSQLKDVKAEALKHSTVTNGANITVTEGLNKDGGKEYNVALNNDIHLFGDNDAMVSISGSKGTIWTSGSVTAGSVAVGTAKADGTTPFFVDSNGAFYAADSKLVVDKDGKVTATAVTAGKTSISDEGVKVGDKTYISDKGLNANDQKVTNVAAGEISATSKDAVNGSQLYATNQEVANNTNRINKLGSRVNKVGAGAAALAALHPMDFDPDDKLTFSAGYGNYAGENAAAIGAYYRPDEKVMFSVAGTVGNGENMVNAGVSFALDRTNHVSNSRTALAREVIDLRGQLAVMGAKMAKMEKAFGMLDETKTKLFPDVPANHWAYEYIAKLAGNGYIEGYPDGNFGGERLMTRYEFAAMLYRAIENGAALEEKIIKEFEPELGRIRVDRISGEDGDRDKIERVRVNDTKGERDHYGNKLAK